MTTRLLLVRHGQTDSNAEGRSQGRRDTSLNERGRAQATALVAALLPHQPVAIYSSPSERARETVAPLAEALGLAVSTDERLAELDQGELDGLLPAEMRERAPDFLRRWMTEDPTDLQMPGGESMGQAQRRMVAAVEAIAAAHPEQPVVAATHNLALRALLCRALDVPLASFRRFRTDVASLSIVEVRLDAPEERRFAVETLNERCHLPDPDGG